MPIAHIHTYLVHPGKAATQERQISGNVVPLSGRLFDLLGGVYAEADRECKIEISFNAINGEQANPCRDALVGYLADPTLRRGEQIAQLLERVTTHRSGMGLLFLVVGREGRHHKIVVSRFPADSAILAQENARSLSVEFLERVFMKSATAYKAAVYQDSSLSGGFWDGKAIDKQIESGDSNLSDYWIFDFLQSDFRTTGATGTRRLGAALREAARKASDVGVKSEIAAAVTLAGGLRGRSVSIRTFADRFHLSDAAKTAIFNQVNDDRLLGEAFRFDPEEFRAQVPYRTVQLDSGGILTADAAHFDQVWQREEIDPTEHRVRFSTEGVVTGEKLEKSR